jgi:hypothetical protein
MILPDLRQLWSDDAMIVERTSTSVIDVLEREPTRGIDMLSALAGLHGETAWPCETVQHVMSKLEQLAEKHQFVALLLMLCLSGPAGSSLGCDDICDAIALWVQGCKNPRIARFLDEHAAFQAALSASVKPLPS